MRNQAKRGTIKALTAAFGIATVLGLSAGATPAFAHDWDHGRGHHAYHRGWDHGRHYRHDRDLVRERYYYAPPRYYAPPPVYYAPAPGYYYDSSPNVSFGLSLGF